MIYWSKWSVDFSWMVLHRCYIHPLTILFMWSYIGLPWMSGWQENSGYKMIALLRYNGGTLFTINLYWNYVSVKSFKTYHCSWRLPAVFRLSTEQTCWLGPSLKRLNSCLCDFSPGSLHYGWISFHFLCLAIWWNSWSPSNEFEGVTGDTHSMIQIWSLHHVQSKLIHAPLLAYRATVSDWNHL